MSRPGHAAPARLDPLLLRHLVDDAAVFPPGSSPLETAVADHLARLGTPLARWTGPLLVPAADAARLPGLAGGRPLRVGLVARPGTPVSALVEGARALEGSSVEVASVELGWSPGWRQACGLAPTVVVEIPRPEQDTALDDAAAAKGEAGEVLAKWRTGATPTWPWPDATETAHVLVKVVQRELGLKLTGGLHHLVRADRGTPEAPDPQHGLLNVLVAVDDCLRGAPHQSVRATLETTDPEPLVTRLTHLSAADATIMRRAFRSYGCCTVTDPLGELAELDLLPQQGDPA